MDEIKKYCLKDVELTKKLYEFGKKEGHVLFYSRDAMGRVAIPVHWGNGNTSSVREILNEGLKTRHSVRIEYSAKPASYSEETSTRLQLVDVYKMFNDTFEAYCHLRQATRIFKLGSVLSARLTNDTYKMIEDVQSSLI